MSDFREYLKFQLRTVNVPATLPHKARSEEIEDLPQYMEVVTMIAPGLALLNVGEEEPGSDRSEFPWIKLNSSGEPIGLYVNVGGTWEPAQTKYFIRDSSADMCVERGNQTVSMDVGQRTWKTFTDAIEFDEEFDDIPDIKLWFVGGNILEVGTGDDDRGSNTFVFPIDVTTKGFSVKIMSDANTSSTARTVKFLWEAIGRREDT